MALGNGGRVNIVITNQVLRYSFHKNASVDSLVNHGEIVLPEGTIKDGTIHNKPALIGVLKELVHKHKWGRKKLHFCVPDDTVVIRQLEVPLALSRAEIKGYVKTQIGTSLYLPFANPALDVELLDADKEIQKILLFAYPKDKLDEFIAVFTEVGLKPVVADLTSLSVYRYYYHQKKNKNNDVLLIHWNNDSLVLTAFNKHQAVFTRYRNLDNYTSDEQMINEQIIEINRIIDFYQFNITNGSSSITRLLLSGDFSKLQQVKSELLDRFTIPIDLVAEINQIQDTPTKYTDVLGLAMKKDTHWRSSNEFGN